MDSTENTGSHALPQPPRALAGYALHETAEG